MREIKFRAWHRRDRKWVTEDMVSNPNMYPVEPTGRGFILTQSNVTLCQYTGLKDANGVEIYEGDIVELSYGKCAVEWNDDRCLMQFSDGSPINYEDTYGTWKVVIGNIYQKPELLEGSNAT